LLIYEVHVGSKKSLKIKYLCEIANVSRSGYYAWCKAAQTRAIRDERDYQDYEMIAEVFYKKKQKAGWRTIKMDLENNKGKILNHKRIRRIMNKFGLQTKIRRAKPYRKLLKATQEHKVAPNLLARQFGENTPQKVFLTDITYLHYGKGQKAYLSAVKDLATREIVAFHVSSSLSLQIVFNTLNDLKERLGEIIHPEAMIHSDQGFHYTHPEFQQKVKSMRLKQSMSRKGNCLDNAPMESFFGHFKDEVDYQAVNSLNELRVIVGTYIYHYNFERYQWSLQKMTPADYRGHLLAA
jgi:transposase InsO family protein